MDVWHQLYDLYWLHYSADLSFLHRQTFLAICRKQQKNEKRVGAHSGRSPSCDNRQHGHTPLLLAFLALTTRHCPGLVERVLVPGRNPAIGNAKPPDLYALSAEQHLRDPNTSRGTRGYDPIHARLLLTVYNCSIARCNKALLFLGEAAVLVRSMDLDRMEQNSRACSSALTSSLAYESSMMQALNSRKQAGVSMASRETDVDVEIRTRTFWSCYILDSQLQLGKGRRRLLQDENVALQQHATHDEYWFESENRYMVPANSTGSRVYKTDSSYIRNDSNELEPPNRVAISYPTTSTSFWPCSRIGTLGHNKSTVGRDSCQESSLSLYIKGSNLLAQISSWALCGGRRCVVALVQPSILLTSTELMCSSPGMLHLVGMFSFDNY